MPVAARPETGHFVGFRVQMPLGGEWMAVSCEWYVPGTGLCNGPIPRPEESFRLSVCEFSGIGCNNTYSEYGA